MRCASLLSRVAVMLAAWLLAAPWAPGAALAERGRPAPQGAETAPGVILFSVGEERLEIACGDVEEIDVIEDHFGFPALSVVLNPKAAKAFAALTGRHVGQAMAIAVAGETVSEPVIREPLLTGRFLISGGFEPAEMGGLAERLCPASD